jgi:carbonic anhydrase
LPERKKLLEGFKIFRKKYYEDTDLMVRLSNEGASPDFFIIHCIDPRSGSNTLFDADPGTIFGDRVMAALVPPYEEGSDFAASLTYAVDYKKIKHVIILGHTECGGIEALVDDIENKEISGWMSKAKEAFEEAKIKVNTQDKSALYRETEKQAIIMGLKNLMTYPAVKNAFKKADITLNGWLYNLKEGAIYGYDPKIKDFVNITPPDGLNKENIIKKM